MKGGATEVLIAAYGSDPGPSILAVIARGANPVGQPVDRVITNRLDNFPYHVASRQSVTINNETYDCFAVDPTGTICGWSDANTYGYVYRSDAGQWDAALADEFRRQETAAPGDAASTLITERAIPLSGFVPAVPPAVSAPAPGADTATAAFDNADGSMVVFDSVFAYPSLDKATAAFKSGLRAGAAKHAFQVGDEAVEESAPSAGAYSVKFVLVRVGNTVARLDFLWQASKTWDEATVMAVAQEQSRAIRSASG
jgi:hypothetical protein